jgi:hypothetical protein
MIFKMLLGLLSKVMLPVSFIGIGANPLYGQMTQAANNAGTVAGAAGGNAAEEGAQLNPFFTQEMKATHGFTPGQTNEMLTAAEAGAGGATGGLEGELNANAARTGNATGVGKSLDEMARDRSKAAAGASEGIAAQDVMGAKTLNQEGAKGMEGLYGTNTSAQLDAMKQQSQDLSQAAQQNQGWLKPVEGILSTASGVVGANPNGMFGG